MYDVNTERYCWSDNNMVVWNGGRGASQPWYICHISIFSAERIILFIPRLRGATLTMQMTTSSSLSKFTTLYSLYFYLNISFRRITLKSAGQQWRAPDSHANQPLCSRPRFLFPVLSFATNQNQWRLPYRAADLWRTRFKARDCLSGSACLQFYIV